MDGQTQTLIAEVGEEFCPEEEPAVVLVQDVGEMMSRKHCFRNGKKLYHIAIIDYLQEWNFAKKAERFTKTVLLQKDGPSLSAIEPGEYARRFKHFVEMNVFT